jgi:GDPmannose 4,6-dehydratase
MNKIAFVTGCTGQDASYLIELLLEKNYIVHGLRLRSATYDLMNLENVLANPNLHLHYGDITDGATMAELLAKIQPDEVYNLAAQSQVRVAFDAPISTSIITGIGAAQILHLTHTLCPNAKFYQASSSEMFGKTPAPQNEESKMHPISPYSASKIYAYYMVRIYREAYGMFACNGLLFNHESPRRGETFVSRKICKGVANIAAGKQKELILGNLDAKRDWGYAKDYVYAMWQMMQLDKPEDIVIGMGETHTVEEFVDEAFKVVGLNWKDYVKFDDRLKRPAEVNELLADTTKAQEMIGWKPETTFKELVKIMVNAEIARIQ